MLSGLKGIPRAGDHVRVMSSESSARNVSNARSQRTKEKHFSRLAELAKDHFDSVVDEATGETKRCVLGLCFLSLPPAVTPIDCFGCGMLMYSP
jgi:hypothetical protein